MMEKTKSRVKSDIFWQKYEISTANPQTFEHL